MKRLLLSIVFSCFVVSLFAKDSTTTKYYFSVGGAAWNHFSINQVITNNGGDPFHLFAPEMGFGFRVQNRKIQGDLGMKAIFSKKSDGHIPYKFQYGVVQLALRYNVLKIGNRVLFAGINFGYTPFNFTLYPHNSVIDLDKINPQTQTGMINMKSYSLLLGPSILFDKVVDIPGLTVSLALSYQFSIVNRQWEAANATLLHPPIEDGNKLTVSFLIFPFQN